MQKEPTSSQVTRETGSTQSSDFSLAKVLYPDTFYQNLRKLFPRKAIFDKNRNITHHSTPNALLFDDRRHFWSLRVLRRKEGIKLNDIFTFREGGTFIFHLVGSKIKFGNQILTHDLSFILHEKDLQTLVQAIQNKAYIGILFLRNHDKVNPRKMETLSEQTNFQYHPTEEDIKYSKSFIRKPLEQLQIRNLLLFLDAEFTLKNHNNSKSPLSVTIMDYSGAILLNTLVSPRIRVSQWGERIHGIVEPMVKEGMDEFICLEKVHKLVRGRILVGVDLRQDIKYLHINPQELMGIRDMSMAEKVFKKIDIHPKQDRYALRDLAEKILYRKVQLLKHSSKEDVIAIREIYLVAENIWQDDIILPAVQKDKISIEQYKKRREEDNSEVTPGNSKLVQLPHEILEDPDQTLNHPPQEVIDENILDLFPEVNDFDTEGLLNISPKTRSILMSEDFGEDLLKNVETVDLMEEPDSLVLPLPTPTLTILGTSYIRQQILVQYVSDTGHPVQFPLFQFGDDQMEAKKTNNQ